MAKHSKQEIEDMRETLKAFGPKNESYYKKCSNAQIIDEYDRHMKGAVQ